MLPVYCIHMRHMLMVLGMSTAAILVGAALYVYGPSELRETPALEGNEASAIGAGQVLEDVSFSVLAEGMNATVTERKNYAVYSEADFARLWGMAYGETAPAVPEVDFDTHYVIGVFAGQKPSGGHGIKVSRVTDDGDTRTVAVTLTAPGAGCMTSQALTAPFELILVPVSSAELARTEETVTTPCQ